jgi:hypothetical protein
VGDHPWICHPTCVNYHDAKVTTLANLLAAKDGGALRMQEPLAPHILKKIRNGSQNSERMKMDHAALLDEQGLIDENELAGEA